MRNKQMLSKGVVIFCTPTCIVSHKKWYSVFFSFVKPFMGVWWQLISMINDDEHLFMCLLTSSISFFVKYLFKYFVYFSFSLGYLKTLFCYISLLLMVFTQFVAYLFIFLAVPSKHPVFHLICLF